MKKLLLLLITIATFSAVAQVAPNYYAIKFTDKNDNPYSLDNPEEFLTQRSIDRRTRQGIDYYLTDLPITPDYVTQVADLGVSVRNRVKWINTIIIKTTNASILDDIMALPFVEDITKISDVNTFPPLKPKNFFEVEKDLQAAQEELANYNKSTSTLDYGQSYQQINLINGIPLHDAGFQGQGMVIAVLDAGFIGVPQRRVFDSLYANNQILGAKDFASEDDDPFAGSTHGTKVLSTMGANWPGQMIGTAPKADYWLLRTEFTDYENIIEEYSWVAGAAFADSVGADIINSSLGYTTFDDPNMDHTWADLDGNTTIVTIGADMAAAKGILPVNSAGNSGGSSWQYIGCPADGDSVFAIGAVDYNGQIAGFSSRGVPTDPRIKPNICAVGSGTIVADAYSDYITSGSGTSFSSPIVAGMTACLWQANYDFNNMEIMEALQMSSDNAMDPDKTYGYGVPDYNEANSMVGIANQTSLQSQIKLYPNPASDYLSVENISGSAVVKIYDVNARVVLETTVNDFSAKLNINQINTGVYLIQIISDTEIFSKQFIKK